MSAPLKLLLVTKSTGGVAEYVRRMLAVDGLDRAAFDITVACLSENGEQYAAELSRLPGVRAFALAMNRYRVDPFSDARVLFALAKEIRRGQYDLVHAHASKPGFLARLAALGSGVPVLYSPHCFAFHAGAGRLAGLTVAALERLAARFFTARIVLIADGERDLARRYGVGSDRLFVTVHTGLDPRPYRQAQDAPALKASLGIPAQAPLVGTVGRLSTQKAPLDFVRMAAQVRTARPDVHFAWVGSGPLLEPARQLARELGLQEVLHFTGQRPDVPAILQTLDCFVLCSLWEGFPLVLLEAMAAGAPVVATAIPGSDEAVRNGQDGLLSPAGNPEALAQAVLMVLDDPRLAGEYRASASRRLEQEFSLRGWLEGLSGVYRQTARGWQSAQAQGSRLTGRGSL